MTEEENAGIGVLNALLALPARERGRRFEHLCKWFLENDPVYRDRMRHVWLWKDWPGRWGIEAGIDLVAETITGTLWAVQAKAYSPRHTITKDGVNTFLSESARGAFSHRLLIATTNRIGATARRTINGQEKPVSTLTLSRLQASSVRWPETVEGFGPQAVREPLKRPQPHQLLAIDALIAGFRRERRGQLVMACGTGKTLVALWLAEQLPAPRVLVLVPSLSVLAQTISEWTTHAVQPIQYLPVCSDDTVGEPDQIVAHVSELGFPATTDVDEIALFLRGPGRRVVFATYQSSFQVAKAIASDREHVPLDLVVADEAHRCAGPLNSAFATVLDDAKIPATLKLFMTATPRFFTGRVVREMGQAGIEMASMDDPALFGPLFHRLSFSDAIEQGLLSDYRVAVVFVDDATVRDYVTRRRVVTLDGIRVRDARDVAAEVALAKAMRIWDLRRVLTFHGRVAKARALAQHFSEVVEWMPSRQRPNGPLWFEHINGQMSASRRAALLSDFQELGEGTRGILTNARCLTEGVDVPTLDAIAFIDPRQSSVDIIQAVGRAIRRSKNKQVGTVILPIFMSSSDIPEHILEKSQFNAVWDVLRALRSHDEDLGQQLDELRRELGMGHGVSRLPSKLHIKIPARIGKRFASALRVKLIEATTEPWEFWLGLLKRYAKRESHARVELKHQERGHRLGLWVSNQRARREALSPEQVWQLEAVPEWSWKPYVSRWDEHYSAVKRVAERIGCTRIGRDYLDEKGRQLGRWLQNQRSRPARLDAHRRTRLEALPSWSWHLPDDAWEAAFAGVKDFAAQKGHTRVPYGHRTRGGLALGWWVQNQRASFRRGTLDPDRVARLEDLRGWVWDVHELSWESALAALKRFVRREGHARVPTDHQENGLALGKWVAHRRAFHARGELSPTEVSQLEVLKGWAWNARRASWEEGFAALRHFAAETGHTRVPALYREGGLALGGWVRTQRGLHGRGQLSRERTRRLKELPEWSWTLRSSRKPPSERPGKMDNGTRPG